MGQTPAEIEAGVRRRRAALGDRISNLEQRVRDDIDIVRSRSAERVEGVKSAAMDMESRAAEKAKGVLTSDAGADTKVAQHPVALVAGSAVGGLLLGLKTGGSDGDHRESERDKQRAAASGGLMTVFAETIRGVVGAQAGALVETALDASTSGLKSAVTEITGIGASDGDAAAKGAFSSPRDAKLPGAESPAAEPWRNNPSLSYGDDGTPAREAAAAAFR